MFQIFVLSIHSHILRREIETHIGAERECRVLAIQYCVHTLQTILMRSTVHAAFAKNVDYVLKRPKITFNSLQYCTTTRFLAFEYLTLFLCAFACSSVPIIFVLFFSAKTDMHIHTMVLWIVYYHNYDALKLALKPELQILVFHTFTYTITTTKSKFKWMKWKEEEYEEQEKKTTEIGTYSAHTESKRYWFFVFFFFCVLFICSPCYGLYVSPRASFNHHTYTQRTHIHKSIIVLANTFDYAWEFFFWDFFYILLLLLLVVLLLVAVYFYLELASL